MASHKRIACGESVFRNLREQKEEMGLDWNGYLKWLYEEANAVQNGEDVDFTPVMDRIDELQEQVPEETAKELENRMGGR